MLLVEEARHDARCFGPVAPGYEACCVPLNSLHLVDVWPSQSCVSVLLTSTQTVRTIRVGEPKTSTSPVT